MLEFHGGSIYVALDYILLSQMTLRILTITGIKLEKNKYLQEQEMVRNWPSRTLSINFGPLAKVRKTMITAIYAVLKKKEKDNLQFGNGKSYCTSV